jgi:glycosyltransferase involved in cell wall biosynthesis
MKIAYLMTVPALLPSNGVRMQALTWKQGLEKLGHQVDLVDTWGDTDWKSYDIVHCFEFGENFFLLMNFLKSVNPRVVLSPIIDHNYSPLLYNMATHWGCARLRLFSKYYRLRCVQKEVKTFFVRSLYERRFMEIGYGVEPERIAVVPLACRLEPDENVVPKEPFCLHVSLLADARKNVTRLVSAAQKYGFELVLAGRLRNEKEQQWLHRMIDAIPNVSYLGFLSNQELMALYRRAKVFALPSLYEGVGLVALEAAAYGCNIVLTKRGGPREYYAGMATLVDPACVTSIGLGVLHALHDDYSQPALREHILRNYSMNTLMPKLVECYRQASMQS